MLSPNNSSALCCALSNIVFMRIVEPQILSALAKEAKASHPTATYLQRQAFSHLEALLQVKAAGAARPRHIHRRGVAPGAAAGLAGSSYVGAHNCRSYVGAHEGSNSVREHTRAAME